MPAPNRPPPAPFAPLARQGQLAPDPQMPKGFSALDRAPQNLLPLQGVTVLVVEDSRFACEVLRLMSMRAGARMRRATTLKEARAHLRVYRPDVVIVDLGLPDGRGEALIRDLARANKRPKVILGTSGSPEGRSTALAAGADGFLDKPLESLAAFCQTLRQHMPGLGLSLLAEETFTPDRLAQHDDLASAAHWLATHPDTADRSYVTAFLQGVAHHARDAALAQAAGQAASPKADLATLRRLVGHRLAAPEADFFARKPR
jgi:DNA-binding response OmpR family regulator